MRANVALGTQNREKLYRPLNDSTQRNNIASGHQAGRLRPERSAALQPPNLLQQPYYKIRMLALLIDAIPISY